MAYAVDNTQQLHAFLVAQYGSGPVQSQIESYFFSSPTAVDTAQGTGANLEVLSPVAHEIAVATTSPEPLEFVADQNSSATTEDFDVSGPGRIGLMLTAPKVDFSLTGSGIDTIYATAGNDTIDASGAKGNETFYLGTGNETVTGGSGDDTFYVDRFPGFETGNTNTISITGGSSGNNSLLFSDPISDASVSTVAGVTTVNFTSGPNAGQDVTFSNMQFVAF